MWDDVALVTIYQQGRSMVAFRYWDVQLKRRGVEVRQVEVGWVADPCTNPRAAGNIMKARGSRNGS